MVHNKWAIYDDQRAMWTYHFPVGSMKDAGLTFSKVLGKFLEIGRESRLINLHSGVNDNDSINAFIHYYEALGDSTGKYVNVNNDGLYVDWNMDPGGYYFSTVNCFFDRDGIIREYAISKETIHDVLLQIGYPDSKAKYDYPFEFKTGRTLSASGQLLAEDITIILNSDLWMNKVPGDVGTQDSEGKNQWIDNTVLAKANGLLNPFMEKMADFTRSIGGEIELNEGGLTCYEGKLTVSSLQM